MKLRFFSALLGLVFYAFSASGQTLTVYKSGTNLFGSSAPTNGTIAEISTNSPYESTQHERFSYTCAASAANVWFNFSTNQDFRAFTHVQIAYRGMNAGDKAQLQLQSSNATSGPPIDMGNSNAAYAVVQIPIWSLKGFTGLNLEQVSKLNLKVIGGSATSSSQLFIDAIELVVIAPTAATTVYKNGSTLITGTWNVDGTLAETAANSPFEGIQHYQFPYSVGGDSWAGFGLNMDGWGSSSPRNFDGSTHFRIAVRGLAAGHTMTINFKTLANSTSNWEILGGSAATYQVINIPLPLAKGVSGLDRRLITEMQFNISAPANATGTVFIDAMEIVNSTLPPASTAWSRANALGKGFNLNNWLEAYWMIPSNNYPQPNIFTKANVAFLKSTGYNHVRMPVVFGRLTGAAPGYALNTTHDAFKLVDSVIKWTGDLNMKLIIDYHHDDPQIDDTNFAAQQTRICAIWRQLAQKYNYLDPNRVFFELYNEPNGISNANWRAVQKAVLDTVRLHSPARTIVVGATGWNGSDELITLEPYSHDQNVLYTYHHYSPFEFTHQQASWINPPPPARAFPLGNDIQNLLDKTTMLGLWSSFYNQPFWMGELGCIGHAAAADRCTWVETVGQSIDQNPHPWAYWDVRIFPDGFGYYPGGLAPGNGISCFLTALHLSAGALPIELTDFSASCREGRSELIFSLFSTKSGSKTTIERSSDGFSWEKAGELFLNEGQQTHRFLDQKKPESGLFYRLRTVESDGSESISGIVRTDCAQPFSFAFSPNPVIEKGQIRLSSGGEKEAVVRLFSPSGQLLKTKNWSLFDGQNDLDLDFENLSNGAFWLTIEVEGQAGFLAKPVILQRN